MKEIEDSWMPSEQALVGSSFSFATASLYVHKDNIREICKAVLLSPSIPSYSGKVLLDIILVSN